MYDKIIAEIEAIKDQIYYVDGLPQYAGDARNNALDEAISIIRKHTQQPDALWRRIIYLWGMPQRVRKMVLHLPPTP